MRHYVFSLLVITLAALSFSFPSFAENAPKIAVVNIQKIMRDSQAATSVRDQLKGKQSSFQTELDNKEKELQKEDQELVKQRANLAQDAFNQKVSSFRQKANQARQEIQNKRAQLDKGFSSALTQIQTTTIGIITEIAKEKSIDLVLTGSTVLFANQEMDITDEVLSRLNKKVPSISVQF